MNRTWSIAVLCVAEVLAMSTWFSANSVMGVWKQEFALSDAWAAALTSSVSVGFVLGALVLSLTGTADRVDGRRIFAISAVVCAIANLASLAVPADNGGSLLLRVIVGASAAGIYPIGMRLASTWAVSDMGLLVGLLVGAQVFGLSLPHLVDAVGGVDWHTTIMVTSLAAAIAALLVSTISVGPQMATVRSFRAADVRYAWTNKSIRLANIGYLGHMWELFAMWSWIALFLQDRFDGDAAHPHEQLLAKYVTFASVAAGAFGCVIGGRIADRVGRTKTIIASLFVSGTCAVVLGSFQSMPLWLVSVLCLVWGFSVVSDSPQFSAAIVELSPPGIAGTMILAQVAIGFSLTVVSIQIVPSILIAWGWAGAFSLLACGPVIGITATWQLRHRADARLMGNGQR
ncbi:MAG: MFS transporter [Caldimonas sp.]